MSALQLQKAVLCSPLVLLKYREKAEFATAVGRRGRGKLRLSVLSPCSHISSPAVVGANPELLQIWAGGSQNPSKDAPEFLSPPPLLRNPSKTFFSARFPRRRHPNCPSVPEMMRISRGPQPFNQSIFPRNSPYPLHLSSLFSRGRQWDYFNIVLPRNANLKRGFLFANRTENQLVFTQTVFMFRQAPDPQNTFPPEKLC